MFIRRRFFTLIEMVISITLTLVLLTTLTFFYNQMQQWNREAEKLRNKMFERIYVNSRLSQVLPAALPTKKGQQNCFFSLKDSPLHKANSSSLIFVFDRGVNLDAKASGKNIGRLYLDKQNRLCLASGSWEDDFDKPLTTLKQEVLLENVDRVEFFFYQAPNKDRSLIYAKHGSPPDQSSNSGGWINHWPKEHNYLPPMIKIKLTMEKKPGQEQAEEWLFGYSLPNSYEGIIYES